MDRVLDLVDGDRGRGHPIHHIDFGGGLGIDYNGERHRRPTRCGPPAGPLDARGFGDRPC
jgi:diaminopimelate decarboxylase